MDNVTEYGCEKCGAQIMMPVPKPEVPVIHSATLCDECGYETYFSNMRGFQCLPKIWASLRRICTPNEFKVLRLSPEKFVSTLTGKLVAAGVQELEVDTTTKPPTVRVKM